MRKNNLCIVFLFAATLMGGMASGDLQETYVFERMWPVLPQPWYFQTPTGMACDEQGYICIADTWNSRIQKYSSGGQLVTLWGREGTGAGEFYHPRDVAVDLSGQVYVLDSSNGRVQKFDGAGQYLDQWPAGSPASSVLGGMGMDCAGNVYLADSGLDSVYKYSGDGDLLANWGSPALSLNGPVDVAVNVDNQVYVLEQGGLRVTRLDSNGNPLGSWGGAGTELGRFTWPESIALDELSNVYVTDKGTIAVQKFDPSGTPLDGLGQVGDEATDFAWPRGIVVTRAGQVLVSDGGFHDRIQVFSSEGRLLNIWGSQRGGENEFNGPLDLAIDENERTYVVDFGNSRIQMLDADGRHLGNFGPALGQPGHVDRPFDVAADGQGHLYVADFSDKTIKKFALTGEYQDSFGGQGSGPGQFLYFFRICVDENGFVYGADTLNNRIHKFDPEREGEFVAEWDGTQGEGEREGFLDPYDVAADGAGFLYVADTKHHRVVKLTTDGAYVDSWGGPDAGAGSGQFDTPYGIKAYAEDGVYVVEKGNDRIQKLTPDGVYVTQWGGFGNSPGKLNGPNDVIRLDADRVLVADELNNRVQSFSRRTVAQDARAVIVAGGGPYKGNFLWDTTQICANFAYRTLNQCGFGKESIYYLSADTDLDLDQNGLYDDVDADATKAGLETALTTWAAGAEHVVVYLTDHGGENTFRMSENEILEEGELDAWLTTLEPYVSDRLLVIIDSCKSGSFVGALTPVTPGKRVVIASTLPEEDARFLRLGTVSFSMAFWTQILHGDSVANAFRFAEDTLGRAAGGQHPLISVGLAEMEDFYIGRAPAEVIPPLQNAVAQAQLDPDTRRLTVLVSGVSGEERIAEAWGEVAIGGETPQSTSRPVLGFPSIELSPTGGTGEWKGSAEAPAQAGDYQVTVLARDWDGLLSEPLVTSVPVGGTVRHCALIVAVGGVSDVQWPAVAESAELAYEALRFQGYAEADIKYYASDCSFPGCAGQPTVQYIRGTLEQWSQPDVRDVVVFVAGPSDAAFLDLSGEVLRLEDLKLWLDQMQTAGVADVLALYDTCASGQALAGLKPEAGMKRIVIGGTGEDDSFRFLIEEGVSFSRFFWQNIFNGANIRQAFNNAKLLIEIAEPLQIPQLDDNGDGIYNSSEDGIRSSRIYLGSGIVLAGDAPYIGGVCPDQVLDAPSKMAGTEATLWIENIVATGEIGKVWAVITPPGPESTDCGIIQRVSFPLVADGEDRYAGAYDAFDEKGTYDVSIYAMDDDGDISAPVSATIRQQGGTVTPDAFEPDNSRETASWIGIGAEDQAHNFHVADDADWAFFLADAGDTIAIETLDLGLDAHTLLALYGETGDAIKVSEDNSGDEPGSSFLYFEVKMKGFYFVRVTNVPGSTYSADAYYTLRVWDESGGIISGLVTGIVTNRQTGLPIEGAQVSFVNLSLLSQITGPDGLFVFIGVPEGTYTLLAAAPNHDPSAQAVTVQAGQTAELAFALAPKQTIEGEPVSEEEGEKIIPGVLIVRVADAGTAKSITNASVTLATVGTVTENVDGIYVFPAVDGGTYTLTVSAPSYRTDTDIVTIADGGILGGEIKTMAILLTRDAPKLVGCGASGALPPDGTWADTMTVLGVAALLYRLRRQRVQILNSM